MRTEIKELTDYELLGLEHDTEVDLVNFLPGRDVTLDEYCELSKYHTNLKEEIETRKLTLLPRLNGFG